jgi:hypothetical protein
MDPGARPAAGRQNYRAGFSQHSNQPFIQGLAKNIFTGASNIKFNVRVYFFPF